MQTLSFDIIETQRLFTEKRILDLRGLSSRLIREAALANDYGKAELGIIAYALHKIETKPHFMQNPKWGRIKQSIIEQFTQGAFAAKENDAQKFLFALKKIIIIIRNIDDELGNYAQNIYDKAKVKQASLAYSYGLSIAQSAALTGADPKELQSYVGFTTMPDEELEVKSIGERVTELKKILEEN
ncbi:MAG: hypothetical protein NTY48_03495 [Candidatus Diapherotrites archaeon]|nr:hypothetical protein [Candidatus Diapherotrites archaeon]